MRIKAVGCCEALGLRFAALISVGYRFCASSSSEVDGRRAVLCDMGALLRGCVPVPALVRRVLYLLPFDSTFVVGYAAFGNGDGDARPPCASDSFGRTRNGFALK
jgi:hypothetical protein